MPAESILKKRILIVTPSLSRGGSERFLSNLCIALSNIFDIRFLLFEREVGYESCCPKYLIHGLKRGPIQGLVSTLKRAISIRKFVKSFSPDAILSSQGAANLATLLFVFLGGWKYIRKCAFRITYDPFEVLEYSINATDRIMAWLDLCLIFFESLVGILLLPSYALERKVRSRLAVSAARILVLHTAVNTNEINLLAREEVRDFPTSPVIINVGRLVWQKGQHTLLKSFSLVRNILECKLIILGEGPLHGLLCKLAKDLHISDDVIFLGNQPNVFKFLARSQIFVSSSWFEGISNALIEALALGIPVISTDCAGSIEVLGTEQRYGILVRRGDVNGLAHEIIRLLSDNGLRSYYSFQGREASKKFDLSSSLVRYRRILGQLCNS